MSSTMKLRSTSDPIPAAVPDGFLPHFATLPARVPRNLRAAEPFPSIGASALLSMDVSHSGWVRKEGYGYRNWKSRFMVLHHGCIYYFKETDSSGPKGKFSLNGYRCLLAPDRERIDRYPYVFKLVPDDEDHRTYYISSPSKSEMEGWMKSVNVDIQLYCPSEYDYVDTTHHGDKPATNPTVPTSIPNISRRETEYCPTRSGRIAFPSSLPTSYIGMPAPLPPPKPCRAPSQDDEDTDEHYESVDNSCFSSEGNYVAVLPNEINIGNSSDQTNRKPLSANNGRPLPPVRPKPPPRPPEFNDTESEDEDSEEELYLDLIKANRNKSQSSKNGSTPSSPDGLHPIPPPRSPSAPDETDGVEVTYVSCVDVGSEVEKTRIPPPPSPRPKPPPKSVPKPPPRAAKRHSHDQVVFDYLPADCFQPDMHKHQAKVFLELGRIIGEYMINSSTTSDTKMSLSVWLGSGVKHYLIFKRQDMYTLDPSLSIDEHFTDLRQLVKYYYKHKLPKSGNYLTSPFASK